jgi:hypothetical protein
MSVQTLTTRWEYVAGSGQTVFAYDNIIYDEEDLEVYQEGALLTLNVDYTVTGVGDPLGGTVVLTVGATLNDAIVIVTAIELSQGVDLPYAGAFASENVEEALDRLTRIAQQLNDLIAQLDERVTVLEA